MLTLFIPLIIVAIFEIPVLIKKKYKRDLVVFIFFVTIAIILNIISMFGFRWNLVDPLVYLFEDILHFNVYK